MIQIKADKDRINLLVNSVKGGREDAFAEIYDLFSPALFGLIRTIVRSEDDASDLLQDAFVKIWKNIDSFNVEKGTLFTWMLNISRNTAIDFLRKTKKESNSEIQNLSNDVGMRSDLVTNPETIGMKSMLLKLPEEQRILIDYVYFRGYTQSEIAEELDMPIGTVKTRIRAAMGELRKWFNLILFWI